MYYLVILLYSPTATFCYEKLALVLLYLVVSSLYRKEMESLTL